MRSDVSKILAARETSGGVATADLVPLVYAELRRLAQNAMNREAAGHTLQATALVNEALLRLLGPQAVSTRWVGREAFFHAAAESMRRVLIDHARAKKAVKRGGGRPTLTLTDVATSPDLQPGELLDFDEALTKLFEYDESKAELVRLRFFAGLTLRQAADIMDMPQATAHDQWTVARAWLFHQMQGRASDRDSGTDQPNAAR